MGESKDKRQASFSGGLLAGPAWKMEVELVL
jgi:hypothetical protein